LIAVNFAVAIFNGAFKWLEHISS